VPIGGLFIRMCNTKKIALTKGSAEQLQANGQAATRES
ncbi:uncharacterized protein METZ01_LOCUS305488, partial [marine metagenome]